MNNAVATFKVGTLWFIIIAGLVTYNRKIGDVTQPGLELEPSRSFNQQAIGFGGYGTAGWMSALLDVCFSYGGFENANCTLKLVLVAWLCLSFSFGILTMHIYRCSQ